MAVSRLHTLDDLLERMRAEAASADVALTQAQARNQATRERLEAARTAYAAAKAEHRRSREALKLAKSAYHRG